MTTIREALQAARNTLSASDSADLDAQVLLCHILAVERSFLFAHGEHTLDAAQQQAYLAALTRCAAGEPIAYVIGSKGFYDIDLLVSPAVLIPRPETELLLEEALRLTAGRCSITAADIGTGSGALAIAFARHRPQCCVYATDTSSDALFIACENARRNAASLRYLQGDLAHPLIDRELEVGLLMANLPYVATDELAELAVSKFEPRLALDGGADGLHYIRQLMSQLPQVCRPGAWILLEIGAEQGAAVAELVAERHSVDCHIIKDYAGLDRIAKFQL